MLHSLREAAVAASCITPNGKTTAILRKIGHVQLLVLYQYCCEHNVSQLGSNKFKPVFARSVVVIHHTMAKAGIHEVGPRQLPSNGVSFHFGGQMKKGQRLNAATYIEALMQEVEQLHELERCSLERFATAILGQFPEVRRE